MKGRFGLSLDFDAKATDFGKVSFTMARGIAVSMAS